MRVTLRAEVDSEEKAAALLIPALRQVRERLGEFVFSEGAVTMDESVAALFARDEMTLALAESCTGGTIAGRITSRAGSSRYFLEGAVTYADRAKTRQLGVPKGMLAEKGAVSGEVASAMSKGIREAAGSSLGLAVTGIAGPDGGSAEKPVGTVFISLAAPDGCWTKRFQFHGDRDEIRTITAWTALDWLRRYLLRRAGAEGADRI